MSAQKTACRHGVSQKPQIYLLPIRSSRFGVKETHTPISMLERPQTSAQGWVGLQGEEGGLGLLQDYNLMGIVFSRNQSLYIFEKAFGQAIWNVWAVVMI